MIFSGTQGKVMLTGQTNFNSDRSKYIKNSRVRNHISLAWRDSCKNIYLHKKLGIFLKYKCMEFSYMTLYIPGFLKTGLAKISTHSATWQFKTTKLIQRPIKSLYLTPVSKLVVPRSIRTSPHLTWRKF